MIFDDEELVGPLTEETVRSFFASEARAYFARAKFLMRGGHGRLANEFRLRARILIDGYMASRKTQILPLP